MATDDCFDLTKVWHIAHDLPGTKVEDASLVITRPGNGTARWHRNQEPTRAAERAASEPTYVRRFTPLCVRKYAVEERSTHTTVDDPTPAAHAAGLVPRTPAQTPFLITYAQTVGPKPTRPGSEMTAPRKSSRNRISQTRGPSQRKFFFGSIIDSRRRWIIK